MSWFGDIFSSSVGEVIKAVGDAGDKLFTSDQDRLKFQNELIKIQTDAKLREIELETKFEEEISKRWESDNQNGSILAKNVRPATLVYLLAILTVMAFFDGNVGGFKINPAYIDIFQALSITAIGGYFTLRSIEKVKGTK